MLKSFIGAIALSSSVLVTQGMAAEEAAEVVRDSPGLCSTYVHTTVAQTVAKLREEPRNVLSRSGAVSVALVDELGDMWIAKEGNKYGVSSAETLHSDTHASAACHEAIKPFFERFNRESCRFIKAHNYQLDVSQHLEQLSALATFTKLEFEKALS